MPAFTAKFAFLLTLLLQCVNMTCLYFALKKIMRFLEHLTVLGPHQISDLIIYASVVLGYRYMG